MDSRSLLSRTNSQLSLNSGFLGSQWSWTKTSSKRKRLEGKEVETREAWNHWKTRRIGNMEAF
ncbi:hypothetical protein RIB2604_03100580 [Aspergillus luchuensis]|uniref:Uncharacterized protein n=1 Tax=Aspergillus kawachii TaxID=1069201 RepID=A0A146FW80_ASPKA|nr:hypothetical protein RIB2604_03100580 [Aspergillus luchuensis]